VQEQELPPVTLLQLWLLQELVAVLLLQVQHLLRPAALVSHQARQPFPVLDHQSNS
jgi:hypothetical protein